MREEAKLREVSASAKKAYAEVFRTESALKEHTLHRARAASKAATAAKALERAKADTLKAQATQEAALKASLESQAAAREADEAMRTAQTEATRATQGRIDAFARLADLKSQLEAKKEIGLQETDVDSYVAAAAAVG